MRIAYLPLLLLPLALWLPRGMAQELPDLGDIAQATFSPQEEKRLGENIMHEIRRDLSFNDDPELTDYINTLGYRLVAASADSRQDFEFFVVNDPTLNAFAMPGGFIGVHSGLVLAAQSESELAGVLAHEVAHVTQRHIARQINKQGQLSALSLAGLALALLASRASGEAAQAAMVGSQAGAVAAQLNFSRDFEREADRAGFQTLQRANFNVQGMAAFFERLQKNSRLVENNAPAYLRTHPLTGERISDMQNRAKDEAYRQVPDSMEFQLVRAKLRAEQGNPRDAMVYFQESLREKRFSTEFSARYGYAVALARAREFARAEREIAALRAQGGKLPPMVVSLGARIKRDAGDVNGAREVLRAALLQYPDSRPLNYAYIEAQQASGMHQEAVAGIAERLRLYPKDARLYGMQARSYAALGKRLLQHQSQAQLYYLQGSIPAAIEQLQLAQKGGDGDFYQMSSVDARLRELRQQMQEEARQKK
jgi:predicted Zn-dependent protease